MVRVEMSDHGKGQVWIDGVEVPQVRAVRASAEVGEVNVVTLEMVPHHWEFEGPASCLPHGVISTADCRRLEPIEYGIGAYCRHNEARCQ